MPALRRRRYPTRALRTRPVPAAAALLFPLIVVAAAASAPVPRTLAVSPSGSDSAPCTPAHPCRSFARAYSASPPGSTVLVGPGTYGDQLLTGSAPLAASVVFKPRAGAVVLGVLDVRVPHVQFRNMRAREIRVQETRYVTFQAIDAQTFDVLSAQHI